MMPGKWRLVVNGRAGTEVPLPTAGRKAAALGPPGANRLGAAYGRCRRREEAPAMRQAHGSQQNAVWLRQ